MRTGRIVLIILSVILVCGLIAACSFSNSNDDMDLEDVVDRICEGVDVPAYEIVPLDSNNFEYFAFVSYEDGYTAVAADALVNITPHSLVIIHTEDGNGQLLAEEIFENADPNKWLCVGSEALKVACTDHYVALIMSYRDVCDGITANFEKFAGDLNDGEFNFMTADNDIRYVE